MSKVDELENRSRRNNLIIYGIQEETTETSDDLANTIKNDIFLAKLDITVNNIERCHRIGKKEGKTRPVIIKLLDHRDKTSILKACSKLKGSDYSISEDFSKNVRETRKKLWLSSAEERAKDAKVKLVFDKLIVNGTLYGWNEERGERFIIAKNKT